MKHIASFALILAAALVQPAFAEDQKQEKKPQHGNVPQGRSAQLIQGNRGVNPRGNFRANVNTPRISVDHSPRKFTPAVANTQPLNTGVGNRNWRRGGNGNWNNGNGGNWQNNNANFRPKTDASVSNDDWQNRSNNVNNSEWNRSRWSNNHNWDRQRRNRAWWRSHYTRFALFGGGYYYWNGGYWYPAYGYDPYYSTYSYDAPIYAYNDQDPGQVIAQVQAALQRRGYEPGGVDGTYGPNTRRALLNYQRDNGLPVTGQIDESTLDSLGLQ